MSEPVSATDALCRCGCRESLHESLEYRGDKPRACFGEVISGRCSCRQFVVYVPPDERAAVVAEMRRVAANHRTAPNRLMRWGEHADDLDLFAGQVERMAPLPLTDEEAASLRHFKQFVADNPKTAQAWGADVALRLLESR